MTAYISTTLLVSLLTVVGALAHIFVKIGVTRVEHGTQSIVAYLNIYLLSGMLLFGLGFPIYGLLLKRLPLNLAQCFIALQFIAITFAAYFFLAEPIPWQRWIGIMMIGLGVALVGRTA